MRRTQQNSGPGRSLVLSFFLLAPGVLTAQQDRAEWPSPWVASLETPADVIGLAELQGAVHKEPIIAGVLSWLLPGLGSFYADNSKHGVRHLIIEGVGLVVFIAGAAMENDKAGSGDGLIIAGYTVFIVNGVWSIITAVQDANAFNNRKGAGPLEVRPAIRRLVGGGGPLTPAASRAGLEVVRLTF